MIDLDVVVLTGAGVSAESGVPTFRDAQTGLWARYDPRDLATPDAFDRDPQLVWRWYAWRRELVARAQPNPAHVALAALESEVRGFTLITQNVDGLHRRAGSRNLLELHGNIGRSKCSVEGVVVQGHDEDVELPRCPVCGAFLRPDVVWFGEMLDAWTLAEAERLARECDVLVSIGTSAEVYPAAALPQSAKQAGALVIEINPVETPVSAYADQVWREPAGAATGRLADALRAVRRRGT